MAFNSLGSFIENKKVEKPKSIGKNDKKGPKTPKKKKKEFSEIEKAGKSWASMFENNKSLIHVDIAFNLLPWKDFFDIVAEGLA